jgi:predicted  nucleic acid-binding Zn-ribbon protein
VKEKNGIPYISRGPMRQFSPSMCYQVRSEKLGGIKDFRSDSLIAKCMTTVKRKIAEINQEIKERKTIIVDLEQEIKDEQREIELLQKELTYSELEPEYKI